MSEMRKEKLRAVNDDDFCLLGKVDRLFGDDLKSDLENERISNDKSIRQDTKRAGTVCPRFCKMTANRSLPRSPPPSSPFIDSVTYGQGRKNAPARMWCG